MTTAGDRRAILYPTRLAIVLMFAGAPPALALGVIQPLWWLLGVGWIVVVAAAMAIDARRLLRWRLLDATLSVDPVLSVGVAGEAVVTIAFAGEAPPRVEAAIAAGETLRVTPSTGQAAVVSGAACVRFAVTPARRGTAHVSRLWARWRGPLGLVRRQIEAAPDAVVTTGLNIEGVKQEAVRLFARQSLHGLKTQLETGEGSEFHALKEFQPGMDTRSIDWKQSARHGQLLSKEYRSERNNPIILAVDSGRSMCEPIGAAPRLDVALNASLLLAYVSLKVGDRAGLYSFDIRPGRLSRPAGGVKAFALLQRAAAEIDYSSEETNYTLGLSRLADSLDRRSMVVVFSEFSDSTSAEAMVETVGRLLATHLVVFVVMRDDELEAMMRAEPVTPEDVSRAVIAHALHRERALVLARLRRLGVEIVDAPAGEIGARLLDRYLELKRRNRI